jgi:hypothetical protein
VIRFFRLVPDVRFDYILLGYVGSYFPGFFEKYIVNSIVLFIRDMTINYLLQKTSYEDSISL